MFKKKRVKYDVPWCERFVPEKYHKETIMLDDVGNVLIEKETIVSGPHFQRVDFRLTIHLSKKTLEMPILVNQDLNVTEDNDEHVRKLSANLSQIISTHKRTEFFVKIEDKGIRSVE